MIDKLTYDEFNYIINALESSSKNLDSIITIYKGKVDTGTARMERFSIELKNYIKYLKNTLEINKDADIALETLRELNK